MIKQLQRIERLHGLIRLKATGNPKECARKLKISERQLYRLIDLMKELNAPVYYNIFVNSYCYEHEVEWTYGFKRFNIIHKHDKLKK
ncbi:hypothetical protein [uncultured Roseivirga sp.]|uniref:hypothetical protein n=1 Tax=uncultured Roseivirga sp. TaxID=543088 RepID=UPI0030DD497A|tara:strand:+ start:5024 stop:5284 length:261 start_codon:yes stop_codon:yes gene_type:complete